MVEKNVDAQLTLNSKKMLFGILDKSQFEVNFCILHAKWYIHKTRKSGNNNSPVYFSFLSFLTMLKNVLRVDKEIATIKMNEPS